MRGLEHNKIIIADELPATRENHNDSLKISLSVILIFEIATRVLKVRKKKSVTKGS